MPCLCYLADASSIHTRRWAAHFAGRGYQVHVISFLPGDIPGTTVHLIYAGPVRAAGGNWHYLLSLPALRRQLRRLRPDMLHAHYLTSYGLLGALSGCRPLVLTAWGSDVLVTPRQSWVYRLLLRLTLAHADLVTSDAQTMSQELLRYGLSAERLLTIPLGVNRRLFHAEGREWPQIGCRLLSARDLLPNTDLETVLRTLVVARQIIPSLHLDVVGDGPERLRLERLARSLGIEDAVSWHGRVPHEQLASLFRASDLYLALTYSDSTSVSLLEAMACGTFPLVSDLPANREWITPGVNGLIVPFGDVQGLAESMIRVAADPEIRRQAARRNSMLIAVRADWQKNMDQIEAAYSSLFEKYNKKS
ncbi:MAG: glycosyltransferase [Anaerolineae bacterium]